MTKQNAPTKQQHWVPRFYLRSWIHQKDQLWCFDKSNGSVYSPNYQKVAGSSWFYDLIETRDPNEPELYQAIEKLLADIEGQCAPLIDKLRIMAQQLIAAWPGEPEGIAQPLTEKERHKLSGFIALQHLRTAQFRSEAADSHTKYHQLALEKILPIGFPDLDPADWTVTIDENEIKKLHIEILLDFQSYIPYFRDKYWIYGVNVSSKPLITSDNPVVLLPAPVHPTIPCDGIDSYGMQIIFPVSPKLVITMYDPKMYPHQRAMHRQLGFLTEQTVYDYNELQLRQCRRQIFSSTNEFDAFRKLCSDEPEICEPNDSRFPVEGPEIEKMHADLVEIARGHKAQQEQRAQQE